MGTDFVIAVAVPGFDLGLVTVFVMVTILVLIVGTIPVVVLVLVLVLIVGTILVLVLVPVPVVGTVLIFHGDFSFRRFRISPLIVSPAGGKVCKGSFIFGAEEKGCKVGEDHGGADASGCCGETAGKDA